MNGSSSGGYSGTAVAVTGTVSGGTQVDSYFQHYTMAFLGYGANNYSGGTQYQYNWVAGPAFTVTNSSTVNWNPSANGDAALYIASTGAPGQESGPHNYSGYDAGTGGGLGGLLNVTHSGVINVYDPSGNPYTSSDLTMPVAAIKAYSLGGNGGSYNSNNDCCAGNGGGGNFVSVTTTAGSQIYLTGIAPYYSAGIEAISQGGLPGHEQAAGNNVIGVGGSGWTVNVDHAGMITSDSNQSVGILALSEGGSGLAPDGTLSMAGGGGTSQVTLQNTGQIDMTGGNSIGVFAASTAGAASTQFIGTNAGGSTTVNLSAGSLISVGPSGLSIGVLAVSSGSASVLQPFAVTNNVNASGGAGDSGTVTVNAGGTIETAGQMAIGVAALSIGGAGIVTNTSGSGGYLGGVSTALPTQSAAVDITNTGTITTNGASSYGILGISTGGGGGLINQDGVAANVIIGANTLNDSYAHPGGTVSITNDGTITTGDSAGDGNAAIGIVAQSIGGGGGSASGVSLFVGDQGGGGGNGDTATVSNSGTMTTSNDGAIGILAQSVGGGGGNGGNAVGIAVAVGGEGGNGGAGGTVNVGNTGTITTAGDFATGIIAQSIGGGGGNGGYAKAVGPIAAAVGGTGGGGGIGGAVTVTNGGTINTTGEQSSGIMAQSVGGGGGNGGSANAYSTGSPLTISIAVGGSGGSGQLGGSVSLANTFHIATTGPDAIGMIAQSVGGGGGNGGSATAKSLAIAADEVPGISFSTAIGGSGGGGSSGGGVTTNNQGTISTLGNGSIGILAQSIGGGGGNGGDSTAAATAIEAGSMTFKASVSVGGAGGASSDGGTVNVTTNSCSGCQSEVQTVGNNATAILAQSIGGGGGNGGSGDASVGSPNLGGTTGSSYSATFAIGGVGGASGAGNTVTVANGAGAQIVTSGSGSQGILAQSIGGGGGNGGGGTASGSGDTVDVDVAVGANGGAGGSGGGVAVTNAGTISTGRSGQASGLGITTGGDAVGILAQSIGGGGGTGGSSDPGATISKSGQVEDALNSPSNSYSGTIGVGGKGADAGSGGSVSISNSGSIVTLGERAYGMLAQSIGGGGGTGGAATSAATSVLGGPVGMTGNTYNASITVGGVGGAAGTGGGVTLDGTGGTILTAGYAAHGMLAQSIGGGGGVGAEGSVNDSTTIGLGIAASGSTGSSGDGGTVLVKGSGSVTTLGDDAVGILAQSIGGGGGLASAGCSNSGSASVQGVPASGCFGNTNYGASGTVTPWNDSSSFAITLGGSAGASGNGNTVTINAEGSIVTKGARAFGISAQSIGGGGGMTGAPAINLADASIQSQGSNQGAGGGVSVTLLSSGSITTSGAGAWGILAQSIGGGGGFVGDASLPMAFPASNTLSATSNAQTPNSGTVTVNVGGDISTTGANAHGIFAQAIGGGGGIAAGGGNSTGATLIAGNGGQFSGLGSGTYTGAGGAVTITQIGGTIQTSGAGSIGIVAQSSGNQQHTSPITITIGGTVIGGTNTGYVSGNLGGAGAAGILVSGGASAASGSANTVTVNAGGSVGTQDGAAGTAIVSGYGLTNVVNSGTITGSIDLAYNSGATPGTLVNNAGGVINPGSTVVVSKDTFTNSGTVNVWGRNVVGTTNVTGSYEQTPSGRLIVDVDALGAQTADLMTVSDHAVLAGTVVPQASALLPGALTYLTSPDLTSTATVQDPLVIRWHPATIGNSLTLSPTSNFRPQGVSLSSSQGSLADYLTRSWTNADRTLARSFGYLSQIRAASGYADYLTVTSARGLEAQATVLANAGPTILGTALSCPIFVDPNTRLGEDSCAWAKFIGQSISEYSGDGDPGYHVAGTTYRLGAQKEFVPNWFVGGSLGASANWLQEGNATSNGQSFDGSIAVKHTMGPWLFAGSVALANGSFQNERIVSLPAVGSLQSVNAVMKSNSDTLLVGGRMRGAYEFSYPSTYVRFYGDLDLVYTNTPGFDEAGSGGLPLSVRASSATNVVMSPTVEFGGRYNVNPQTVLRPFVDLGVSFMPNSVRQLSASTIGGLDADGTFTTYSRSPDVLGRFNLGLQLYRSGRYDAKIEYGLQTGSQYFAQSGTLAVGYHF